MDFPPSKLSNAASRLWGESTGHFQKKTDVKIDLGLQQTISTNGRGDEKASTSSAISSGFVFGSRMSERVASNSNCFVTEDNKISDQKTHTDEKPLDVSSIFKKIAANNSTSSDTVNLWKSAPSNGSMGIGAARELSVGGPFGMFNEIGRKCDGSSGGEVESAEAEPQKITTGEENELNLLHINCRFYQYNAEAKTWQERGMGSLKVNQRIGVRDDVRIVGRQSGNQRVLINSKIFPEMILEELSEKRLKISAQVDESDLPQLFLVQASPGSIGNLYVMLQKYIDACHMAKATQQLQLRKRRLNDSGENKGAEELEENDDEEEGQGHGEYLVEGVTKKFAHEQRLDEGEEESAKERHPQAKKKRSDGGGEEEEEREEKMKEEEEREEKVKEEEEREEEKVKEEEEGSGV